MYAQEIPREKNGIREKDSHKYLCLCEVLVPTKTRSSHRPDSMGIANWGTVRVRRPGGLVQPPRLTADSWEAALRSMPINKSDSLTAYRRHERHCE